MATNLQPTVSRVTSEVRIPLSGPPLRYFRVDFVVGTHGPFTVSIPAEQFTAARVKEEMDKVAATINQLPQ
jgi:hypothetical protein